MKINSTSLAILFLCLLTFSAQSQVIIPQHSFDLQQKMSHGLYSTQTRFHSTVKPMILVDSSLNQLYLNTITPTTAYTSFFSRKLFQEHLVEVVTDEYAFYADLIPDFLIGKDSESGRNTFLYSRGFNFEGSIGKKFQFQTSGYENQARFAQYYQNEVARLRIIPGMVNGKRKPNNLVDWAVSSAILAYSPSKYINLQTGYGKNFIGHGYRSMLLSDISANYPYVKITATVGNVQYMSMWAQFLNSENFIYAENANVRKKYGVFHHLNWNVTNRLTLGFFDSIIWEDIRNGEKRGFELAYLNPIAFLRPIEGALGSPDNALIGIDASYKISDQVFVYGQFIIDELVSSQLFNNSKSWVNKSGYQIGVRTHNIFKIQGLNLLTEFTSAKPFTYSHRTDVLNFGHYNEALAHPTGANFRENVSIINYTKNRWNFKAQYNRSNYGLDSTGTNLGQDIFKSYDTRTRELGNITGQGIKTQYRFLDLRVAYTINPKTNLRLEAGFIRRKESNSLKMEETNFVTFGLRGSFRNLYSDY